MQRDDYVVREARRAPDGRVVYTLVDMAGRVTHLTVDRNLTARDGPVDVMRHHVARARPRGVA